MQVWFVQAILGDRFEDLYLKAASAEEALALAEQATALKSRWTRFVL